MSKIKKKKHHTPDLKARSAELAKEPPPEKTDAGLVRLRTCPFCKGHIVLLHAYTLPAIDRGRISGPLFEWNVRIACECCAQIDHCESVAEAISAWNSSDAPFMADEYAVDVAEAQAAFDALPESKFDQEEDL